MVLRLDVHAFQAVARDPLFQQRGLPVGDDALAPRQLLLLAQESPERFADRRVGGCRTEGEGGDACGVDARGAGVLLKLGRRYFRRELGRSFFVCHGKPWDPGLQFTGVPAVHATI